MESCELSRLEVETIMAFANNGMKVQKTAEAMHYDKRTISQRLSLIRGKTGINPRDFWGLVKLTNIIKEEKEAAEASVHDS